MAMERSIMEQKPGRLGQKLNYQLNEKAMPELPSRARQAHDWIWEEIKNPDISGLKTARRWSIAGPPLYVKFTREEGHLKLSNVCTLPRLHMQPELRRLQCWWLPKLPKTQHPVFYHPPVPRRRRANTIWTRPQMWHDEEKWGARWDISHEYDRDSEVEARQAENTFYDRSNTMRHYKKHKESIEAWRKEYRKYWYRQKTPEKVQLHSNLRSRKWDLDELHELEEWGRMNGTALDLDSLNSSEFIATDEEPSESSYCSRHEMNQPGDDWYGS